MAIGCILFGGLALRFLGIGVGELVSHTWRGVGATAMMVIATVNLDLSDWLAGPMWVRPQCKSRFPASECIGVIGLRIQPSCPLAAEPTPGKSQDLPPCTFVELLPPMPCSSPDRAAFVSPLSRQLLSQEG